MVTVWGSWKALLKFQETNQLLNKYQNVHLFLSTTKKKNTQRKIPTLEVNLLP